MKRHHNVLIYTSLDCKMCELTKDYFRDQGIDYLEINISRDPAAKIKMIEISNQEQTPVVEIDGRAISGYRPDVFDTIINKPEAER